MSKLSFEDVSHTILDFAKKNNKKVDEVRFESLYAEHPELSFDVLEQHGGLATVKKLLSKDGLVDGLVAASEARASIGYTRKLEKLVGDEERRHREHLALLEQLSKASPIPSRRPKAVSSKPGAKLRENVGFISDTHFGLNIRRSEVRTNEYNWTVAARRMSKFAQELVDFKHEHRAECPQVRLCLGGDLIQGVIHPDSMTELLIHQKIGAVHLLTQLIQFLSDHYNRVVVETTPDNHARRVEKGGDRARSEKFDSHATEIHAMLQGNFRSDPNVTVNIVETPDTEFDVLGHKFYLTHGDTVLDIGNPGKIVNVGRISDSVNRIMSEDQKRYAVVMLGHVHVPLFTTMDCGAELVINGTGSGLDNYAYSLGHRKNNPVQVLFETTKDYAVGDYRQIKLADADNNIKFENIIEPYHGALTTLSSRDIAKLRRR